MDPGTAGREGDVVTGTGWDADVPRLGIEQFAGPGYRGCRLTGEIDFTSAGPVQATLTAMVLPGGGTVIVDLRRVTFIDSSGLGVLVQAHRSAKEQDTRLMLVASPPVRKLLALTALDTVLETYDELAAAESAVAAAR
jgi:anti-sigma B factor antagonist